MASDYRHRPVKVEQETENSYDVSVGNQTLPQLTPPEREELIEKLQAIEDAE